MFSGDGDDDKDRKSCVQLVARTCGNQPVKRSRQNAVIGVLVT